MFGSGYENCPEFVINIDLCSLYLISTFALYQTYERVYANTKLLFIILII